ncbi:ECF transporter S component [Pseudoramibacter sp.]|jgi:riboflavin transporter FmnP|uniref:ECF transporter S component n=1 Tax=Pseudoramibacter sp. TaxID=2034862 RepID=UPI0025ECA502|nr:ECF transporter S component [Pseudoramibacter sp.]MCH4072450.1 ECF transporter S component [Pseudoramibacter sp.]MCH4106221.1 ECF transporter S component [Pseudoramibacter sp.]
MKAQRKTHFLAQMAVLVAMSVLLVYLIHFPIMPAAPFLEYDPADIPILVGTFLFGPVGGLIITAVACVVQGLTVSASSGIIGILMHFFATGSYAVVAGLIYVKHHTKGGAVLALIAGTLTMTAVMCAWNLVMTPIFMGTPRAAVAAMIVPVIIPFNLIKASLNGAITFVVYKSISRIFDREFNRRKVHSAKADA